MTRLHAGVEVSLYIVQYRLPFMAFVINQIIYVPHIRCHAHLCFTVFLPSGLGQLGKCSRFICMYCVVLVGHGCSPVVPCSNFDHPKLRGHMLV